MRHLLALCLLSSFLTLQGALLVFAEGEEDLMTEEEFNESFDETESSITEEAPDDFELDSSTIILGNPLPPVCPFGLPLSLEDGNDPAEAEELYQNFYKEWDPNYENNLGEAECGTPNKTTNYLEKGDCTANGLLVTEITEVIASDVTLDDDNKVITVYGGLCCLTGLEENGETLVCNDTRTLYTTKYDDCDSVAVNCEKRQWVIGNSGIGIVKLMVKQIFTFAALSVGSIFVGTLVFQGIKISVSGVAGDISEAKNKILQAVGGIVLLFLSGLLLYTINPGFFG